MNTHGLTMVSHVQYNMSFIIINSYVHYNRLMAFRRHRCRRRGRRRRPKPIL